MAYLWISDKFRCKGQVCAVGNAVTSLLQAITSNHTYLVQELEGERWKLLWSGRLYSRTSVIELDNPVRLPALGARGFLLHNPEHNVRMSSPNTGQVKSPILVRDPFRTCCKSWHNATHCDRLPPDESSHVWQQENGFLALRPWFSVAAAQAGSLEGEACPFPNLRLSNELHTIAGGIRSFKC